MHVLPLFYKDLQGFYNVSKTYLRQWTLQKLLKMWNHRKTRNPLFYAGLRAYLPQHCLYLRPLPQVVETPIFIILIIFIILLIFQCFIVLGTYYIYNIYSIFVIINISLLQTNRKQCLHSFTTVIILSISYIYQCAFCIFAHLLYYKYLFLSMNLSNYLYLIISSIISDFVILSKTSVANCLDFSVLEI